jgi:tRNA(fMet)-specific endonuclease VapC
MTLYVLDTDTVTLATFGNLTVLARIGQALAADRVAVAIVTVREIMEGRLSKIKRAKQPQQVLLAYDGLKQSTEFLAPRDLLSFNLASLATFDRLLQMKLNVGKDDLRIAAIALEAGAVVVTRNLRDFRRVPGLPCEDWSV